MSGRKRCSLHLAASKLFFFFSGSCGGGAPPPYPPHFWSLDYRLLLLSLSKLKCIVGYLAVLRPHVSIEWAERVQHASRPLERIEPEPELGRVGKSGEAPTLSAPLLA